jgi:Spy/CpxP family protein refolding chaperone
MKKQFLALALIIGLSVATVASADWGKGRGYGYGDCPQMQGQMMQGPMQGQMPQQLDQATQDKIQKFFKDTLPLHKEMAMKHAEKQALMQSDKPDPQAVAKVTGEMFDLRMTMQEKAELAGVDQYVGPGRMGMGMGMGMGCGGRGHGKGMGQGPGMMNN